MTADTLITDAPVANILLVDDEPNILRALRRVLRQEGYRLLTASNGDEALALMHEEPIDLVVSDSRIAQDDAAADAPRLAKADVNRKAVEPPSPWLLDRHRR
ncbi:response regulator [Halomonas sp. M5N1S17]|uniref:response regulator n=1 Tax=Halomonas alkalisoli TaxID=2907158 RepID=UPI001F265966|nr:response regulator [Halomonas alkalisoli]MCE9665281.1 response regulator [Halomonas alkalisoli]